MNQQTKHPDLSARRRRRSGLSMVEILISLAITALLLTATAIAFDAALTSYKANHDISMVNVAARNAVHQITSTIRSAWNDPDFDTIDVSDDGTECALVDSTARHIIYRYAADSQQLQMNINNGEQWYVLIDNIQPISDDEPFFTATYADDADFAPGTVAQVEMRFIIGHGDVTRTIAAAAVPRNILYND